MVVNGIQYIISSIDMKVFQNIFLIFLIIFCIVKFNFLMSNTNEGEKDI
jgi:hypothetical protein